MTTEIQESMRPEWAPGDGPERVPVDRALAVEFVVGGDVIARRVAELRQFVSQYMLVDEDYGLIPGTQKKTLYKPGAEKLCDVYGLTAQYQDVERIERWEGPPFFHYELRCLLTSRRDGMVMGEGRGSCNSKEERYRWRISKPYCPECGFELRLSKDQPEWYCWAKKGGCGAKYPKENYKQERTENTDLYTLVNTFIKMAKKRALVDAVLSVTRSSGLLTQDLEDITPAAAREAFSGEEIEGEVVSRFDAPAKAQPAPSRAAETVDASKWTAGDLLNWALETYKLNKPAVETILAGANESLADPARAKLAVEATMLAREKQQGQLPA